MELVGAKLLHLLTQTVPSLKSPTGAFIASQTLIFRRKQIIRTHLLSENKFGLFLFGPSGENRTHGLLNPIQARYQNCATPGYRPPLPYRSVATRNIILRQGRFVNRFFDYFLFFLRKVRFLHGYALFRFCCFCQCFSASAARCARSRSSSGRRYWPVKLPGTAATCSGVPSATIKPPALPPSGPRSMM